MNSIDKIPEFHKKKLLDDGNIMYHVTCAYCGNEITFRHSNKPKKCPYCGSTNFRKPKTETQLFHLQRKYLDEHKESALGDIYLILVDYARSIIKKSLPREFTYHYELIDEKASDAATLFIEQYLAKSEFRVENSFGGYLQRKVKEVLWNKKARREENHESLNAHMEGEENSSTEMIDITASTEHIEIEDANTLLSKHDLENGIINLIEKSANRIRKEYSVGKSLIFLGALLVRMRQGLYRDGETRMNLYYKNFGTKTKEQVDSMMLLIYRFIREEL